MPDIHRADAMESYQSGQFAKLCSLPIPNVYPSLPSQGGAEHWHAFICEPSVLRFCLVSQQKEGVWGRRQVYLSSLLADTVGVRFYGLV